MVSVSSCWLILVVFLKMKFCGSVDWRRVKCAADTNTDLSDGSVPLGRFPWLGVVQHSFYMAEKMRFAVTTGVLIHPGYVLAPAEDISRIPIDQVSNNTKFIVWGSANEKYALDVYDYILHPDIMESITRATVAILQLTQWAGGRLMPPVEPICLPLKGSGNLDNIHVVKFDDAQNQIQKQLFKVNYVLEKDCAEFYYRAQLTYEKMSPRHPLCTSVEADSNSCIWDNGVILVSRIDFAYWTLLGFGVRGPGCGAPARFANVHRLLAWFDEVISARPLGAAPPGENLLVLRQLSPTKLIMYKGDIPIPNEYGQCDLNHRGSIIYKDNSEIITSSNLGQGFYFVAVYAVTVFSCAIVKMETMSRTNAALWVEHHCHQQVAGLAPGMEGPDARKYECFIYYKTVAFVEFRYTFSFRSQVSLSLYGVHMRYGSLNPWQNKQTTDAWYPTNKYIKYGNFQPYYMWLWGY